MADRGDRNCSIRKCGAWVGIKPYHNRNWQAGLGLATFVANGYYRSHGSVDQSNSSPNVGLIFDLQSGYHQVDILVDNWQYLGFSWKGENGVIVYYMFRALPFGLTTAPFVYTKLLKPLHGKEMEKQRIKSCTVHR